MNLRQRLLFDPSSVEAAVSDGTAGKTPGVKSKRKAQRQLFRMAGRLADRQEMLYAEGRTGGKRRLIVLLQGTDASGKDGAVKHVIGLVNPAGVRITSFGKPTREELRHDFLWRIQRAVPPAGYVGVFNRSQYEDVLIVRVHDLVPPEEWEQRYDLINAWEAKQIAAGVTFLKVFLHISYDEQRRRLLARLDDTRKHWKINPGDIDERALWPAYQEAYADMLRRCSTEVAPWYVIPADRKWYRNWALSRLLLETFESMDPRLPERTDLDLVGMRKALKG